MAAGLLIIDPQIGWQHPSVEDVFTRILQFAPSFPGQLYIAKFINQAGSNFERQLDWHRFVEPTDTDLIEGFESLDADVYVHTTYSCLNEELQAMLARDNVQKLYISGVFTDVCVSMAAMEAFDAGYQTYLVEDLVGSLHGEYAHDAEIKSLDIVLGSDHLVAASDIG